MCSLVYSLRTGVWVLDISFSVQVRMIVFAGFGLIGTGGTHVCAPQVVNDLSIAGNGHLPVLQ